MIMYTIKVSVQLLLWMCVLGLFTACVAVDENDPRLKAHQEAIEKGRERTQWINAADGQTNTSNQKEKKTTDAVKNKESDSSKTNIQNSQSKPDNSTELINKSQPKTTTTTKPSLKTQSKQGKANSVNSSGNAGKAAAERIQNKTKDRLEKSQDALKQQSKNTREQILKQRDSIQKTLKNKIIKNKNKDNLNNQNNLNKRNNTQDSLKNNNF